MPSLLCNSVTFSMAARGDMTREKDSATISACCTLAAATMSLKVNPA